MPEPDPENAGEHDSELILLASEPLDDALPARSGLCGVAECIDCCLEPALAEQRTLCTSACRESRGRQHTSALAMLFSSRWTAVRHHFVTSMR
jgi:hypothetical protein